MIIGNDIFKTTALVMCFALGACAPELPDTVINPDPIAPALSPAESMKTIRVPDGYRLELVASEPMVQEPVAIAWDGNGRMYVLTYAEAAIEAGQISNEVYDAIDRVRQRSGMPKVDRVAYNSQAKLRELIRRERRVELAFEGLRYWDIKRWNIGAQTLNGPLYGSRGGSVNPQTGAVTWSGTRIKLEDRIFYPTRNYLLPIPQGELDANPNIKQNPGY